jgi:hypothetical protein
MPPIEVFMFLASFEREVFSFFQKRIHGTRLFDFPFSESGMVKQ